VDGKIVITPIETEKKYKLDDLLEQCRPEAMKMDAEDREWLDDEPVGREAW
jgi:antitoxin MazE